MSVVANVRIHPSQFPESIRRDLLASLRRREINHKFHYDSVKQSQKWLAIHRRYSPARQDRDCRAIYEKSFTAAAESIRQSPVHLIGLGCGGGQKDLQLLKRLRSPRREIFYTPCDVSVAMVLIARRSALAVVPGDHCFPLVCDLATARDLPSSLLTGHPSLITFFGMIPNFEPQQILPRLASLLRPGDLLLFSANLAPGQNYAKGMQQILPQYDNPLTRDWLMTFLHDVGIESADGEMRFSIENGRSGLKRVTARFRFRRSRRIELEEHPFHFRPGDHLRLFFSYRYTPDWVETVLKKYRLKVCNRWIAKSGEEGVFLCQR